MLQKAKTLAEVLAFTGLGERLPKEYYTLTAISCQGEKQKNLGWSDRWAGRKSKPAAFNTEGCGTCVLLAHSGLQSYLIKDTL